ncbi:MAG: DUF5060 domain-containing protein [Anaerolineae bacterium]|nr:DUF5060 domain-containing protein [Anaerolineae bacterium]
MSYAHRARILALIVILALSAAPLPAARSDDTAVAFLSVSPNADSVGLYHKFEVSFAIDRTYPNPYAPYSAAFAPDGVSVDGLFSPDGWTTTIVQPGFYFEGYDRVGDGDFIESLYPNGEAVWKVRFAPTQVGEWQYRLRVTDASGVSLYPADGALRFQATPSDNPGFIHVSARDNRFFAFSNGETFFPFGFGVGYATFADLERELAAIGNHGANFFRWWLSGLNIAGSSWSPWKIEDLPYNGYIPPTGLSVEDAWNASLFSVRLDTTTLHCLYQTVPVKPDTDYVLSARVKLVAVGSPIDASQPYGFMFREAGWAEPHACRNPGSGRPLSETPVAVAGTHDWTVVSERFNSGDREHIAIKLNLQNVQEGVVYIDSVSFRENLGDGALGPEVLSRPDFDYQDYFSQRPSWFLDYALDRAEALGLYYKFVILEKNDWLYQHIDPTGRPQQEPDGSYLHGAAVQRLHENYLRYLTARWGYSTSVHSWEAVNEGVPGSAVHFGFVNDMARLLDAIDPNRHMITTSTWCCGIGDGFDLWRDARFPDIGYGDFHAYSSPTRDHNTDWLRFAPETYFDLANWLKVHADAVRAQGYRFPIVAGEIGLHGAQGVEETGLARDVEGVWLHNLLWAWLYDGRVSALYFYTDNIRQHGLYDVFRPIRAFLDGVPLVSGGYRAAEAQVDNANLRAWGQKDTANGGLLLWVQNRAHTWKNVVDGASISPESGVVRVGGFAPGVTLNVETWDTVTGAVVAETSVVTSPTGELVLPVEGLQTDLAFRVVPP